MSGREGVFLKVTSCEESRFIFTYNLLILLIITMVTIAGKSLIIFNIALFYTTNNLNQLNKSG